MTAAATRSVRVVFCWSQISGYMAACWRALSALPGINLVIVAEQPEIQRDHTAFGTQLLAGLRCELLAATELTDARRICEVVCALDPDVLAVSGWFNPAYRALARAIDARRTRLVMAIDTPWKATLRQRAARLAMSGLWRRVDAVVVAGERSWQLARRLGFAEGQIHRGTYGFDEASFAAAMDARAQRAEGWPRRFLFMGRYVHAKAIDVLIEGYGRYRAARPEAWPLTCCGSGPLVDLIRSCDGATDRGFVQPPDQPSVLAAHGGFVLASRYEPWGVVLAEAAAAGLPIICSEACGASVELVRSCYNGLTVPTDDAKALADAMCWMHDRYDELPEMGRRGQKLAAAYSAPMWAKRWMRLIQQFADEGVRT